MASAFLLAGEASGDRIGARLMAGLHRRVPGIAITGVGGEAMEEQGLQTLFPLDDLAVMGYRDVLLRLPLLLWRAHEVVRHILATRPDVVVLIDAQVFSKVVAQRLRKRGFKGRIILYVAPAVWAWGAERARKLAGLFDEVLSVLPFEPRAMLRLGGPETAYVGHPAVTRYAQRAQPVETGPLLLLPGSRKSEIDKHLDLLRAVAQRVAGQEAVSGFVIVSTRSQAAYIAKRVGQWPFAGTIASTEDQRTLAFATAVAAVAVSGTVTLELALAGIPHVITYVAEPMQVRMFEKATVKHIGLPNLIAGAEVVPEILFAGRGEPQRLEEAVARLLENPGVREAQARAFVHIRSLMEKGAPEAPLQDPVERIAAHLALS
ncbi:lipid-A-disaccharide synthase [Pelagibacterium lacus]|nr:lipid-A-disaccharide synthase [Pelagibacterium lacus]